MSGHFIPSVRFPLYWKACKSSRIQIEPIMCPYGYGIVLKVIMVLTTGTGEEAYEFEKVVTELYLTQETLPQNSFYETAFEYFEGFYYNKIAQDVVVPLTAMILKIYFPDLIEQCGLDLSNYFLDFDKPKRNRMGYSHDKKERDYTKC